MKLDISNLNMHGKIYRSTFTLVLSQPTYIKGKMSFFFFVRSLFFRRYFQLWSRVLFYCIKYFTKNIAMAMVLNSCKRECHGQSRNDDVLLLKPYSHTLYDGNQTMEKFLIEEIYIILLEFLKIPGSNLLMLLMCK